jgi:hypothetical protein
MPTPPAEEPITKITFNAFTKDAKALKALGQGWSSILRQLLRAYMEGRVEL